MAFTYDATNVGFNKDDDIEARVNGLRLLLLDREEETMLFHDEELTAWLGQWASVWQAAAELAEMIIGGGLVKRQVGNTRREYLRKMAPSWRARAKSHQGPRMKQTGKGFFTSEGGSYREQADGPTGYY